MPSLDVSAVGQRIRQARRDSGLTQAQLATNLGITQRSVQLYESGDVVPYRRLEQIADICACPSQWLRYGAEDPAWGSGPSGALLERLHERIQLLERHVETLQENVRLLRELRVQTETISAVGRRARASRPSGGRAP